MINLSWWERVHLTIYGWVEVGGEYWVQCEVHGLSPAYVHGWENKVSCRSCLRDIVENRSKN